jgi:hypothetical protein
VVGPNAVDDELLPRQEQERLYFESFMDVDGAPPQAAGLDPKRFEALDADTAFALQLQEEEYSRRSIEPSRRPYSSSKQQFNNKTFAPFLDETYDQPIFSDAELAAHLQAEENQKRSAPSYQRRPPRQPVQRPSRSDDPEIIPMPLFARNIPSDPSSDGNNNRRPVDFPSFLRRVTSRGRASPGIRLSGGSRRGRNLQNTTEDFGPEHYEVYYYRYISI